MSPTSIEKITFCPGPGYGLWESTVMPYGLTGATQTCQQGLDQVLKDCKDCVDNYIDNCIVFSDNIVYLADFAMQDSLFVDPNIFSERHYFLT